MGAAVVFFGTSLQEGFFVPAGYASADPPSFVGDSNAGNSFPVNSSKEGRMGKLFVGQHRGALIPPLFAEHLEVLSSETQKCKTRAFNLKDDSWWIDAWKRWGGLRFSSPS